MPINCGENVTPRYRVKQTYKGPIRLAFCKNEVVEAKKLESKAKEKGKVGT